MTKSTRMLVRGRSVEDLTKEELIELLIWTVQELEATRNQAIDRLDYILKG